MWARGIEGQVALVTGAGRGLGRACALALSQAGAQVIAVARTAAELERLARDAAGPVEAWIEDVRGDALLGRIEALARLDVLVNNAGSNRPQPFLEVTDDALDGLLELNVRAAYRVARSAARVMVRASRGSIIHMSSQMGHVGSPQRSVYCMTKHAIEGLSKAMAVELAPLGIRVNTVAPTFVDTPMTRPYFENPAFADFVMSMIPARRLGTLEEVAAAVVYLASPASGIVTGTSLRLDGGWTAH
ncbi:MAG: 3-oxoacyl-ACP reductase [Betaproteobacteria bacterium SG8_39]|nr:MAG: 3-oxoacyl-ACP reductase [Betaproteobacteria bacterium SG8_39]